MLGKIKYEFSSKMWRHSTTGGWYFVSLPQHLSKEIRDNLKGLEEGWGRMKAKAQIKEVSWDTAIWYDTKHKTYLLPIKAEVRKKTNLDSETITDVSIWI